MSENPCSRWYWKDWDSDSALALCSLAAQGLWMRMLSIAARNGGYLRVNGQPCSLNDIAILVGHPPGEIAPLVSELEARGVFSRSRDGTCYNRRMVRDEKNRKISQREGRKGGNPALVASAGKTRKKSQGVNPPLNGQDKASDIPPGSRARPLPLPLSKEDSASEPDGSSAAAASAATDPTKAIFDRGLAILGPTRRSLLGRLCRDHGEPAVLEAIIACETEQPVEPAAFLLGCLARAGPGRATATVNGHRLSPVGNLYLGAMNAADKFDEIDRKSRDRGPGEPPTRPLLDSR